MATWIAHMRIAEYFMKKYSALDNDEFLVGNIAPDCGVPNEDWSSFTPDKSITHWLKDGENIDAEDFKNQYLIKNNQQPFYMGYYFHLLTDIEWTKLYKKKKAELWDYQGLSKDEKFIWTIKKDWYGQDHLYLQNTPDSVFFTVFSKIQEFPNSYFDVYPEDAFIKQMKYITNFYLNAKEDFTREFPYLSKIEMDNFVQKTISVLESVYSTK